jgi:two-component system LytT family sensor kinase
MFRNVKLIFWVLVFFILTLQLIASNDYNILFSILYAFTITASCFFYTWFISRIIIRQHLQRHPYHSRQLLLLVCLSFLYALLLTAEDYLMDRLAFSEQLFSDAPTNLLPRLMGMWMATILVTGVAYAFELYNHHIDALRKEQAMRSELMELELKLVKQQLSPHFTFNILNNLQFLIQKNSNEAINLLKQYSSVLKYYVYESQQKSIKLKDEIDFLKNFILIEKQRQSDDLQIYTEWDPIQDEHLTIAPFILSAFIENAFKHLAQQEKYISCKVSLRKNNELCFEVKNTYDTSMEVSNKGVGLIHSIKRLDYLYPQQYRLEKSKHNGIFSVSLSIFL